MYLIDKVSNRIQEIGSKTFSELGFKERTHLQEWLAHHPQALGEELLVIQKEFNGFYDTNERLDLLAFDKKGSLVIIENKLDDTGRDVTWQALKYASYCSTLSPEEISNIYQEYLNRYEPGTNAKENLDLFFEHGYDDTPINTEQRIILVAAHFRKEVTSTVLWLSRFNIKVHCFKATPYQHEELLFLKLDQIIPIKEAEDYVIRMAGKVQEEMTRKEDSGRRYLIRQEFWTVLLNKLKGKTQIFQSNSATKDNILYAGGTNMTYVSYVFTITKTYCSFGLKMYRELKEENKLIFDELHKHKEDIESKMGVVLEWDRANENAQSLIYQKMTGVNVFEKEDWERMTDFLVAGMVKFEATLKQYLPGGRQALMDFLNEKNSVVPEEE